MSAINLALQEAVHPEFPQRVKEIEAELKASTEWKDVQDDIEDNGIREVFQAFASYKGPVQ